MKKYILMILLVTVSSSAMAAWVKVSTFIIGISGGVTAYADPDTTPKYGSMVKMWELYDSKRPDSSNTSSKKRVEYDCKKERSRQLHATYYSESMGKGEVLMSMPNPKQWEPVAPGTINKKMWLFACKNR